MKSKNKKITFPLVMCFIGLAATLVFGLFTLASENKILFLGITFACFAFAALMFLIHTLIIRKEYKHQEEDKAAIASALDSIAKDEDVALLNVSKEDEQLVDIAKRINKIYFKSTALVPNRIYKGDHFFEEVSKLIRRNDLDDFIYVRLTGVDKGVYSALTRPYERRYAHLCKDHLDVVICAPFDRETFIKQMELLIENHKRMCAYVAFSRDYSLLDIVKFMDERYRLAVPRLQIYEPSEKSFRSISKKYEAMDLAQNRILNDYLKEIYEYLPFSHIGIKFNGEYYRLCTLGTLRQIDQMPEEDFAYFKEYPLFNFKGDNLSLVLANTESVVLETIDEENIAEFIRMIRLLMVHELGMDEYDALEHRYERLEGLTHNLSYEVNDDYVITYASKRLEESFNHSLKGEKCYKALHNRDEVCKNCPMVKEFDKHTFVIGSKKFKAKHVPNNDVDTIYLLNEEKPFLPNKKDLSIKLLSLINNNGRGYILAVKLDSLAATCGRNGVEVEDVVKDIISTLTIYGLNENLYRKDEDEFVYILEDASVADSLRIAKEVSKAFLEKFQVGKAEVSFAPKIIMLSYPLEVNTLFSLDSLCRRMFTAISDKGRLHRLDENPIPIDNHRYYIEILEQSYKSGELPLEYIDVRDNKGNKNLQYVELKYVDEAGNPIHEDEITLYTKIDKTYPVLVDKVIRALDFDNPNHNIILPIGKEGIDLKMASGIISYLGAKKVDPSRLILEIKEKDAFNYSEDIHKMMEMGFNFAVVVKDNLIYNINVLEYRYIKIDGNKLVKDKLYQFKVNNILNEDIPIMIEEKYVGLLNNVKYICK